MVLNPQIAPNWWITSTIQLSGIILRMNYFNGLSFVDTVLVLVYLKICCPWTFKIFTTEFSHSLYHSCFFIGKTLNAVWVNWGTGASVSGWTPLPSPALQGHGVWSPQAFPVLVPSSPSVKPDLAATSGCAWVGPSLSSAVRFFDSPSGCHRGRWAGGGNLGWGWRLCGLWRF